MDKQAVVYIDRQYDDPWDDTPQPWSRRLGHRGQGISHLTNSTT
jgi:hypothetical protein